MIDRLLFGSEVFAEVWKLYCVLRNTLPKALGFNEVNYERLELTHCILFWRTAERRLELHLYQKFYMSCALSENYQHIFYKHPVENCLRNSRMALNFGRSSNSWDIDQKLLGPLKFYWHFWVVLAICFSTYFRFVYYFSE